jgi:hypothetical protein
MTKQSVATKDMGGMVKVTTPKAKGKASKNANGNSTGKVQDPLAFTIAFIEANQGWVGKNGKVTKGVHTVFRKPGFNNTFRLLFNEDPVTFVTKMAGAGYLEVKLVKGGAMIYLPGDKPVYDSKAASKEQADKVSLAYLQQAGYC